LWHNSGTWTGALEGTAKEGDRQREVRQTFKMLREVWLNTEMEKIDTHKDIMVKVLLDNGVIGMFIDRKTTAKYSFRLQKLERPIAVRNIDRMNNSRGAITHQVKVNVYYKNHIKRIRMDMYDLGKTEVILEMLWLQAYNPEIN